MFFVFSCICGLYKKSDYLLIYLLKFIYFVKKILIIISNNVITKIRVFLPDRQICIDILSPERNKEYGKIE